MMSRFRPIFQGPVGDYLRFLAPLLVLTLIVFASMSVLGCGCSCDDDQPSGSFHTKPKTASSTEWQAKMTRGSGEDVVQPGALGVRAIGGEGTYTGQVQYRWHPPTGATNFQFTVPPQAGGPPYVWEVTAGQSVGVQFNYPSLPEGVTSNFVTDKLEAGSRSSAGLYSTTSFSTLISNQSAQNVPANELDQPLLSFDGQLDSATVDAWFVERWFEPQGITVTTSLCQDVVDIGQGEAAFLALRVPAPELPDTESIPLPLLFNSEEMNNVYLFDWDSSSMVITAPVSYRFDRFDFAANELPAAEGEHWVTLGLDSETPITCPANLELEASRWSLVSDILIDLSSQPDACVGCVLTSYYCYEGQDLPVLESLQQKIAADLAEKLGAGVSAATYQDWGITCVGPKLTQLIDTSAWELGVIGTGHFTPTETIAFHHYLLANGLTLDLNIELTSDLDLQWGLYGGSWDQPNLADPLTNPVTVDGWLDFWIISEPLPASTAAGSYSIQVSATNVSDSTDQRLVSDLFWVGEWVAPPTQEPPPPTEDKKIYLPLITTSP